MNESRGTVQTAINMRAAYCEMGREDFVECAMTVYELDTFTAELFWEVIDAIVCMGATRGGPS